MPGQYDSWLDANIASRGPDHAHRLTRFLQQCENGERLIWAAWDAAGRFLGHITLQYGSEYPPFHRRRIPEIVDLWVEPAARRHGIGKKLLVEVIAEGKRIKAPAIGLGVGITRDFGAAHCLYAKTGFIPDGSGVWAQGHPTQEGDVITLGHDVIMMWVKGLG